MASTSRGEASEPSGPRSRIAFPQVQNRSTYRPTIGGSYAGEQWPDPVTAAARPLAPHPRAPRRGSRTHLDALEDEIVALRKEAAEPGVDAGRWCLGLDEG